MPTLESNGRTYAEFEYEPDQLSLINANSDLSKPKYSGYRFLALRSDSNISAQATFLTKEQVAEYFNWHGLKKNPDWVKIAYLGPVPLLGFHTYILYLDPDPVKTIPD